MSEETQDPTVEDPETGETDPEGEWTPPTRDEWERLQRTAAARKRERDEARRTAAQQRDGGQQTEDQKAATAAREDRDKLARRSAGLTALVEAGMTRAQAKEAVGLLKLKNLDVDEDGDVDGVDDAVKELRDKFPGLFPAKQGGKGRRQQTADTGSGGQSTKTPTQRTNDALMKALGIGG